MRRLLVTGGAGFIGSNFVHYWIRTHPSDLVVVLDALSYAGNRANLSSLEAHANFRFVTGDICEGTMVAQLMSDQAIDTVVHFAAESHVDRSIVDPDAFVRTNVLGTHNMLEAARALWRERPRKGGVSAYRFHHVSTDEIYGSLAGDAPPFTEDSPYRPTSPYAASKAAADLLVRSYYRTYGLRITISNCSNNYGPFQFPEKLIALAIVSILQGQRVPIYGDGLHVRDWLYVTDHCRALERVLDDGRLGGVYNIGGWAAHTNLQVVRLICKLIDAAFMRRPLLKLQFPQAPPAFGKPSSILLNHVADRPGHDRRYALDPGRIVSELDFQPEFSLEEGLHHTVEWYLQNAGWWRPILTRHQYREWLRTNYDFRDGRSIE